MQSIATQFSDRTFVYDQVERSGMCALYRQTHKMSGIPRYEVVRLHIQAAHTWPNGNYTPGCEAYPSATAWGRDAWTFHSEREARMFFTELAKKVARRMSAVEA